MYSTTDGANVIVAAISSADRLVAVVLRYGELSVGKQRRLLAILESFAGIMADEIASGRMAVLRAAGTCREPFNSTPDGGQFDFTRLPARTPHGGASYVW